MQASLETLKELYGPFDLDLGGGVFASFTKWSPDRDLNPQYDGIPDIEKCGLFYIHPRPDGNGYCVGGIHFDGEIHRKVFLEDRSRWQVESFEPLTISPSLLCKSCNSHGFIKQGKWVKA